MAANWALNEQIEESNARIQSASQALSRHFSLPDSLQVALSARLRKNLRDPINALLEKQLTMHAGVADLLEAILTHLSDKDEVLTSHSSLPEDFPARNALASAGIMSVEQLARIKEEDLTAIQGIGKTQAFRIVQAVRSLQKPLPKAELKPVQAVPSTPAHKQETAITSPSPAPVVVAKEDEKAEGKV